jgi:hypothetical protein
VRDETLFFWGMVVTMFLLIAAMLTARELIEMYFEERNPGDDEDGDTSPGAGPQT